MWQSVSGSDTLAGLHLSVSAVSSASDWYCTNPTHPSLSLLSFAFSIVIGPGIGLLVLTQTSKTLSSPLLSFFFSSRSFDRYIVQLKLLPQRRDGVNFCFTLCLFRKKKKIERNFKWRIHQTEKQTPLIWLWMQWTYMALNFKSRTWK